MVRDDASLTWPKGISWSDWTRTFLPAQVEQGKDVRSAVKSLTGAGDEVLARLEWLGLFDEGTGPTRTEGTPAQVIEALVTERWKLQPEDRDMIVMWHRFEYELNGERKAKTSSLCLEGKDSVFTAMSDTVGLPMALAVKPLLNGDFGTHGVDVPMSKGYYEPLLEGLEALGIRFVESEVEV